MVDFTSLNTATLETATRFHNFAKNIETAHLGKLYTTVLDGIDTYVVEGVAKPFLEKAPEWVYENSIVDSIKNNKGLYILAAGIITLFFINYMLHPKGEAQIKETPPKSKGEGDGDDVDSSAEKEKPTEPDLSKPNPLISDDKKDTNIEKTDRKNKSQDPTPVNSDEAEGFLKEDSDFEKDVNPAKNTTNAVNNNGDNIENVEKGNINGASLHFDREVDINSNPSANEKGKNPLNLLHDTTLGGTGNNTTGSTGKDPVEDVNKVETKNDQKPVVNIGATTGSGSKDKTQKENENNYRVKDSNTVGKGKNKNNKGKNKKHKQGK